MRGGGEEPAAGDRGANPAGWWGAGWGEGRGRPSDMTSWILKILFQLRCKMTLFDATCFKKLLELRNITFNLGTPDKVSWHRPWVTNSQGEGDTETHPVAWCGTPTGVFRFEKKPGRGLGTEGGGHAVRHGCAPMLQRTGWGQPQR